MTERNKQCLNFLTDASFQGLKIPCVLSFENEDNRILHTEYYIPKVERKDYNVMIDGKNLLNQPVKKVIWQLMITFKKLQQVIEMIVRQGVYYINPISKNIS